jgi:hypothetical protein
LEERGEGEGGGGGLKQLYRIRNVESQKRLCIFLFRNRFILLKPLFFFLKV